MLGKTYNGHFNGSDRIGLRARREGTSLTSEQLKAARAEKWRQTGNALLTLDDARTWIEETGLVLYLPRRAQLPVEAPSFVEAVLGQSNPTPQRPALQQAQEFLTRLASEDAVIPLNLMGTVGEQPDFLVTAEILPYIFALRGDRDWKRAPQAGGVRSVSPLIAHVYKALEEHGAATLIQLRDRLGSELTEAAILRALTELWSELRVIPAFNNDGEPALWEPLKKRFSKALMQGTSTSQLTAVSILSSLWTQTAIAATSEEAEIFLSPLTSRRKIREVLRGLTATRQLESLSLAHNTYHFVAGSLPEFPEVPEPVREMPPVPEAPSFQREKPAGRFADKRPPRSTRPEREKPFREGREQRPQRSFERKPAAPGGERKREGTRDERGPSRGRSPERGSERGSDRGFKRPSDRSFPKQGERSGRPAAFRNRGEDQTGERPRFQRSFPRSTDQRPTEGSDQPRRVGTRAGQGERPSKPWQKREDRPGRDRQQGGYQRREGTQGRGGEQRRSKEGGSREGGFRPPRRAPGAEGETRERKPRFEGRPQGRSEGRPFNKPRSERPSPGRGFAKRSEGRGPDSFERSGERSDTRPPRREERWKSGEEDDRKRESRPRREAGPGARPAGRFRSERPSQGGSKRPAGGGFGAKSGRPKSSGGGFGKKTSSGGGFGKKTSGGGGFGRKSSGGKFSPKPGGRPPKKFGRKERPE